MRTRLWLILLIGLLAALPALAQQAEEVSMDDINRIARQLYCPVCENIPLEVCGTAACDDWRYEIRLQLESGLTDQQIIDDFVARFGDRVVGTPQDPFLRALSLVTPWVLVVVAGFFVVRFVLQQRARRRTEPVAAASAPEETDHYRSLLEKDLAG